MRRNQLADRIVIAAEKVLAQQGYVSAIDVLLGSGSLSKEDLERWRRGQIPYLERVVKGSLNKVSHAMKAFRSWAHVRGLKPSETAYVAWRPSPRRTLRFSKSGNPNIERGYRTHFVSEKSHRRDRGEVPLAARTNNFPDNDKA